MEKIIVENIAFRHQIRAVVTQMNGQDVTGYQIRLMYESPGTNQPPAWTDWFFLRDENLVQMMAVWRQYMESSGHLRGPLSRLAQ